MKTRPEDFLDRRSYRHRRMMDALRLLPVVAMMLLMLPLFWPDGSEGNTMIPGSRALVYVFGVWALVLIPAFVFSMRLRKKGNNVEAREDETVPAREGDSPS